MKPPKLFTYFGNKAYVANQVWDYFGQTDAYVEPFVGSAAVLLASPYKHTYEAVNDWDCHIVNVFRSLRYHKDGVIQAAYWPRTELDLHMRHDYLVMHMEDLRSLLLSDVKACNPELAGWWIWGINLWLGGGWCTSKKVDKTKPHNKGILTLAKKPVARNQGILTLAQKPVARNKGILTLARKPVSCNRGILNKGDRLEIITDLITRVHDRLIDTNILYGDFERVLTPSYTTGFGTCAVFMDPPYRGYMKDKIYAIEHADTWDRAKDWFLAHMDDPAYRIILCGQDDDWPDKPDSVRVHTWTRMAGMAKDKKKNTLEKLYISPHCLSAEIMHL